MNFKKIAAGALAATAMTVAVPAVAHADPVTAFRLCDTEACDNRVQGTVTWHNRTATVSGWVVDKGAGFTTAKFRAYDTNGKQVGPDVSRYTDDASTNPTLKSPRAIGFGMGDTTKPGGLGKIAVFLCFTETACQHSLTLPKP